MMESLFTSRLNSNYVPTDSESLEIQSLLELPTSRLEELSTQLQQIRNEQSSLRLFISKHRALISLIRKLPIDILQEIFIACLPTDHNPVMSRWEPPILLTQICSSWRNVAHATPLLWRSIHIAVRSGETRLTTTVGPDIDRYSEAVQEWLTRSATCPLDISLGGWVTTDLNDFYEKIIDSLIPFSERWREVRIVAPFRALVPIANLPPSKVPLLETLSLNCAAAGPTEVFVSQVDPQLVGITDGILKAPNLRQLWLRGFWITHLNADVTGLPISWSRLTNVSLEGDSWSATLLVSTTYKILSLCRNLITCQLEIGVMGSEELPVDTTTALISLPFLTRLSVRENATNLSRLFSLLRLPSLNCIEFHTLIRPEQHSSTSLLSLLTRFHNTTQLITDVEFFTRQDFIKCMRLSPLLKSLSVRKIYSIHIPQDTFTCKVDDEFLKLFFESSNDEGYLCPHLEEIEFSSESTFSETTLLQFVKERNGDSTTGIAKLKRLHVVFNRSPLSDSINQELEPYRQAGLVATISSLVAFRTPLSAFTGLPGYVGPYLGLGPPRLYVPPSP